MPPPIPPDPLGCPQRYRLGDMLERTLGGTHGGGEYLPQWFLRRIPLGIPWETPWEIPHAGSPKTPVESSSGSPRASWIRWGNLWEIPCGIPWGILTGNHPKVHPGNPPSCSGGLWGVRGCCNMDGNGGKRVTGLLGVP